MSMGAGAAFLRMKTDFSRKLVNHLLKGLCVCLLSVIPVIATPINNSGEKGAIVNTSDELDFPGSPAPDYGWTLSFISTLSPTDPGFFDLGSLPGSFLMTGNTFFNFTGDPKYLILVFKTVPPSGAALTNTSVQVTPEPATFALTAGLLLCFGCYYGAALKARYN